MPKMPGNKQREPEPDVGGGANEAAVASAKLRSFVERYESLADDKQAIADDQKEVLKEAKGIGLNTKAIKALVKARKDPDKAKEEAEINRLYAEALGLVGVFG
jgi:uncharacterized protein (UPF0335 family)